MAPGGFTSIATARQLIAQRNRRIANQEGVVATKQTRSTDKTPPVSQLPKELGASPPEIYSPTAMPSQVRKALKISQLRSWVSTAHISPTRQFDQLLDASITIPVQSPLTVHSASAVVVRPPKTLDSTSARKPFRQTWKAIAIKGQKQSTKH